MPVLANARPGVRLLRRPWVIAGLLAALGVASTLHLHLDERLLHALRQVVGAVASADRGVALADYRAELEARPVASVSGNLSGLAWDADRDQLWAVVNNPETLLALSPEGETLARYPLDGFTDVEAVAYLGDDRLLLVEERSQKLVVVPVPAAEAPLRAEAAVFSLALGMAGNAGLEGADYDAAGDRLFLVKEHSPRRLLEVAGLRRSLTTGATAIAITGRSAWLDDHDMARDLSSVHHDVASGHLRGSTRQLPLALGRLRRPRRSRAASRRADAGRSGPVVPGQRTEPVLPVRARGLSAQPRRIIHTPPKISSSPATLPRLIGDCRKPAQPK